MKKIMMFFIKALAFLIAAVIILIIGLYILSPFMNNRAAEQVAEDLQSLPLPEKTELVEVQSAAGKLVGNGNGMQYFGAILIKSELSLATLETYYAGYAKEEWECIVEKQDNKAIQVIEHGNLNFETEINSGDFYIVYSWGSNDSIFNEFDLRGH
ncbi:MAG: hypothetical protein HDR00_10745 [Lachnospiraceae bacterium]|nr:hypothetical protein [Lachnospiraceae bacterium]